MNKTKANFAGQTIYVGMDVHKTRWNLAILVNDAFIRNVHQKADPEILANYLHENYPGAKFKVAYEAGKFGFSIQRQLTRLGIKCLVINPADIPKTQKDFIYKTDRQDARNIGYRLRKGDLNSIHIPDEQQEADRILFRHRERTGKDLTRCKNRIKGFLAFSGITIPEQYDNATWSNNFIVWLQTLDCIQSSRRAALNYMTDEMIFLRKELLKISKEIRAMLREPRYKVNYNLLRSIPGIGPLTAGCFLVEIGDIKRFETFKRLNSFVGFLPMEHSSGEKEKPRALTIRNHPQLRSYLIESALTAKRTDPALSLYFDEQIKRKESKVVIIKIARKLLNRIRYVLLSQQSYEHGVLK